MRLDRLQARDPAEIREGPAFLAPRPTPAPSPPPSPLAAWPPDSPPSSPEGQEARGWGSSYLRGEAPGPGGGGGSGCGAPAPRRLLHHNIPRPGARGPRGRAPSSGGARRAAWGGGGRGRGAAILGRARARAREPVAEGARRSSPEGPTLRTPALSPRGPERCRRPARPRPPPRGRGLSERAPQGPGPAPRRAPQRRGWMERERLWRWPGRGRVRRGSEAAACSGRAAAVPGGLLERRGRSEAETDAEILKGKATCLQSQGYSNTFPG
eukprot:XP_013977945.1 uncharacterized protein LOC102156231 [Canis lupus familiaris]